MEAKITATKSTLPFLRTDTGNNYKKYKLATAYLEIPLELRFTANPSNPNKSIKGAIGIKLGTLLNAHTKGKTLQNSAGTKINAVTVKENSKSYFNGTRIAATARVGYGIFSLYGSYGLTSLFKDGVAADTKLIQIGLTISGL
jgi:Outer membrane protein beta-barrel domain